MVQSFFFLPKCRSRFWKWKTEICVCNCISGKQFGSLFTHKIAILRNCKQLKSWKILLIKFEHARKSLRITICVNYGGFRLSKLKQFLLAFQACFVFSGPTYYFKCISVSHFWSVNKTSALFTLFAFKDTISITFRKNCLLRTAHTLTLSWVQTSAHS